ncbi:hypothetical protein ACQR1Y_11630 [Bradyrhizobium sp. HKCCYLRH3099]|uniref:hypothetical protein n=1 Tax=unclassified Bradyrhizobium TaxID=2631580 RepID=UPI003EBA23E4
MTIDEALNDDLVQVELRDDRKGIYVLRFGSLQTKVKITLRRGRGKETAYTQSHAIETPIQAGPYWTSLPSGNSPGDALHKAISGFTMYYTKAVEGGHSPSEDWLALA